MFVCVCMCFILLILIQDKPVSDVCFCKVFHLLILGDVGRTLLNNRWFVSWSYLCSNLSVSGFNQLEKKKQIPIIFSCISNLLMQEHWLLNSVVKVWLKLTSVGSKNLCVISVGRAGHTYWWFSESRPYSSFCWNNLLHDLGITKYFFTYGEDRKCWRDLEETRWC